MLWSTYWLDTNNSLNHIYTCTLLYIHMCIAIYIHMYSTLLYIHMYSTLLYIYTCTLLYIHMYSTLLYIHMYIAIYIHMYFAIHGTYMYIVFLPLQLLLESHVHVYRQEKTPLRRYDHLVPENNKSFSDLSYSLSTHVCTYTCTTSSVYIYPSNIA